ncbi:hypothetical protein EVAR_38085_1 [Eumeta japonica]|uniref:Uncharacterized protein n=1 Tax=Eumeta variegata TaxID=151549 RepID=A0A4C1W9X6_EUMVA|nr:hypothetical protein EVAR_38085_1 [Eumeta japonica]
MHAADPMSSHIARAVIQTLSVCMTPLADFANLNNRLTHSHTTFYLNKGSMWVVGEVDAGDCLRPPKRLSRSLWREFDLK